MNIELTIKDMREITKLAQTNQSMHDALSQLLTVYALIAPANINAKVKPNNASLLAALKEEKLC